MHNKYIIIIKCLSHIFNNIYLVYTIDSIYPFCAQGLLPPTYQPTYLLACLPACLPAYLPACPPACRPTYLPTYLPACVSVCFNSGEGSARSKALIACLPTYLPTYLPVSVSNSIWGKGGP